MSGEQHQKFLGRLTQSRESVLAVAGWLHRGGKIIEIPALKFAPTAADAERFFDEGDILIVQRKIVQVKGISRDFTGRDDWPFPEYLVSNKAAVDRVGEADIVYVTVSRDKRYAAIVDGCTKARWYLSEKLASNTGNREVFYACSLDDVSFKRIAVD